MSLEETKALEMWLQRVWHESPDRPPYAIMAKLLKCVRKLSDV